MSKRYFAKVPIEGIEQMSEIGLPAYAILGVLCHMADREGVSYPSKLLLANEAGISKRLVDDAIKTLLAFKLIRMKPSRGRRSNGYQVVFASGSTVQDALWLIDDNHAESDPVVENPTVQNSTRNHAESENHTLYRNKSKSPNYRADDLEKKIAQDFLESILSLRPNFKRPNLDRWANDVRLMRERDGRTLEEISELWRWANANDFWRANILCPAKLRSQFDRLAIERDTKGNQLSNGAASRVATAEDLENYQP